LRQQKTRSRVGEESRSDMRLVSRLDGAEEKKLEALLARQGEANSLLESLLHTMCSVDTKSAARMLAHLRSGAYDEMLEPKSLATFTNSAHVKEYPWGREL
jgi:hypothetical protein